MEDKIRIGDIKISNLDDKFIDKGKKFIDNMISKKSDYNDEKTFGNDEEYDNELEDAMLDGEDDLNARIEDANGYPRYTINVERGFYTVYELKRKYDSDDKRIILDSDFQRNNVWKIGQKAELIESILMGLPLPIFYFNQDRLGRLIVVDGRQRLTALFEYMENLWPLKGLKVLKELNGKKFEELEPLAKSNIEDYQIQAHVILPPTSDKVKFDIFDRVNRGGTQLNKQEIRNALYQGKSTRLLNDIVGTNEFRSSTDEAFVRNARMKDKYIVLRYIAFELYFKSKIENENGGKYEYKNDIDELLGLSMEYMNRLDDSEINVIKNDTIEALGKVKKYLGNGAFRLARKDGAKGPINMNVFEVVMHICSCITIKEDNNAFKLEIEKLKLDEEFNDSIGNHRDNWNKVITRYTMADEIIRRFL